MAKKPNIMNIASGYYSRQALNDNFEALRDAFDNTLSLDGSIPNAMGADLDMNNNDILNAGVVNAADIVVAGDSVAASAAASAASASSASTSASSASTSAAIAASYTVEALNQQRLACELDVGNYLNGVNTEDFLNAQRPFQDFTFVDNGGTPQILMSIAAEGNTYATNERARICIFNWQEDGSTLTDVGFTGLLNIGHVQGFKAVVLGGNTYIYTTSKTTDASNPGKGVSKITWNGASTTDSDVEQIVLFGDSGSGHIYENLHRAMPTVSDDGRWLIIHAELVSKSNDNGMVLFYDRAEVEAAADPKTVLPKYSWRTENPQWNNAWVKQGISWDVNRQHLNIVYSGSSVEDPKFIETYPITGGKPKLEMLSGNLALYGVDGVLGDAAKGPCVQAEIEGLDTYDGRLFFGFVTGFVNNCDIVSATISGNSMNLAAKADVPTGVEAWDQSYWTRTVLPATAGVHSKTSTYSRGLNKTEKGKFIWEYGPVDARTDWLPVDPELYGLSGSTQQAAGNGLDYSVPIGQALNRGFHSSLGGKDGIPLLSHTDFPGETRIQDVRSDSLDTSRYTQILKVSNASEKYTQIGTSSGGGLVRIYDNDDTDFAGQILTQGSSGVGNISGRKLVADDGLLIIDPIGTTGLLTIWNGQDAAVGGCMAGVSFDVAGTLNCTLQWGSSVVETTTGVLTAGSGTDGKLTVSAASDGKLYVSMRLPGGFARYIAWDIKFSTP